MSPKINEIFFKMESQIPILKEFVQELINFSEKNRKFTAGSNTLKEKMIISFEVSCANHLMAIRDLLFYPTFPEPGNFEKITYQPTPSNDHAITIAVISRAILELAAILYWMLKGDVETTATKLDEWQTYVKFAHAINLMNMPTVDGKHPPLKKEHVAAIKKGMDYRTKEGCRKKWKDLTPNDVRGDFYAVIDKKLEIKGERGLSRIIADFFDLELVQHTGSGKYFRDLYRFLSDIAHSNPYAITSMLKFTQTGPEDVRIDFQNGDPQILSYALFNACCCYCYVLEVLFHTFGKTKEQNEIPQLMQKFLPAMA